MNPWLISVLTLIADQVSKFFILATFTPGESLPLLSGVLHLTYVQNTGAAFGLFKGQQMIFIAVSLLVIAWVVREFLRHPSTLVPLTWWGYALVLGGAAGNLIDRLRFGFVVDFIDVRIWPVFNIGDSAITIGVGLLLYHALQPKDR